MFARAVSWFLKEEGYGASIATRAEVVLEHLRSASPDLVVLDTSMPANGDAPRGEDGGLLDRLAADERWRDIPILATSPAASETPIDVLSRGARDYMSKPFHIRELLARIEGQLRTRKEIMEVRRALSVARIELERAKGESESRRKLVDILHDVAGDFSAEELSHMLVRRVARALDISHCSLVVARAGDETGIIATAYENPTLRDSEISLGLFPEIRVALQTGGPVLIENVPESPLYYGVKAENVRSSIALPFDLDGRESGVFLLRAMRDEPPLGADDVTFAETVVKAAVSAIRRAQAHETTLEDNARLEVLALTDSLTQVLNRRALAQRLEAELDRARRYGLVLSLLMVDLDHFKQVNDRFGHPVGDDVLREVARLLQQEARSVDIVARYGGEEFVAVLPETGEEGAVAFAERVRQKVERQPLNLGGIGGLGITVSIGVATVPSPRVDTSDDLVALADEALYRAKAEGRNRVCA